MIAYFARLLIKGVITVLLSFMLIHTVVSYAPGGPAEIVHALTTPDGNPHYPDYGRPRSLYPDVIELKPILELDRPWPLSSLGWLFDPTETHHYSIGAGTAIPGLNISIIGFRMGGSGVLTGDFGESIRIQRGVPVINVLGEGINEVLLAHLAVLLLAMIIAYVQRLGTPRLYELPARLLPSIAAKRSAAQVKTIHNWQAERPLSALPTIL